MKVVKYSIVLIFLLFSLLNIYTNYIQQTAPITPNKIEEEFDASLLYIRSLNQLIVHVDSLNSGPTIAENDSLNYANLMARTLRMRFVHGWSQYTWKNNWILAFIQPLHPHLMGVVKPDDILNYSEALCSQQSIIGMEALKKKGFLFRKVGFLKDKKGHFTYEIKLRDGWHYYDLDKEPDLITLENNNRPSIEKLANDTLYMPDYIPTYSRKDINKVLKKAKFNYKFISTIELDNKILNSKNDFYYLSFITNSSYKTLTIIKSNEGLFIYNCFYLDWRLFFVTQKRMCCSILIFFSVFFFPDIF